MYHTKPTTSSRLVQDKLRQFATLVSRHGISITQKLPVEYRMIFKMMLICFKALQGTGPLYIKDMLTIAQAQRRVQLPMVKGHPST